jgi:integrase
MAKKTNFEVNGQKYYRVTRTIGHRPDGSLIRKTFYGSGINEANQKADNFINDLKSGLINEKQAITINILLPDWLFGVKKNEVKASTFESYFGTYKKFIEPLDISNIPIKEVKSLKLQSSLNELKTTTNNIKKTYKVLNMFFGYAEKEGYMIKNPCNNISLPKDRKKVTEILQKKQSFQYYNEDEIKRLKEAFKGNKFENVVLFALGTGMRRGEIFGLQWSDIDFDKKEIHVIHNLSSTADISKDGKREYHIQLNTPKTQNSVRIIPMSTNIYNLLSSMKKRFRFCLRSK